MAFEITKPAEEFESETASTPSFVAEEINSETASSAYRVDNIEPKQDAPKKRGRRAGTKNAPKLSDVQESLGLAQLSLGTANALAVTMFGPTAALTDGEKGLLYPPIARSIARLPASSAAKASVFVDPLVIVFGLALWIRRIATEQQATRQRDNEISAAEFASASGLNWNATPARTNSVGNAARTDGANPAAGGGTTEPDQQNNGIAGGIPPEILNSLRTDIDGGNS